MAFQGGAGAEGDHRALRGGADLDDLGDLLGGLGEGDRVGRVRRVVGLVRAVLLAHRRRGGQARAEQLGQGGDRLGPGIGGFDLGL